MDPTPLPTCAPALAKHMALPQTTAVAPGGPQLIPETGGGRAWFTSFDDTWHPIQPHAGETRRARSLAATVAALLPALAQLAGAAPRGGGGGGSGGGQGAEAGGGRLRRVHLLGFSQGGTLALEAARQLCKGRGGGGGSGESGGAGGGGPPVWLGSVVSISGALLEEQLPQLETQASARSGTSSSRCSASGSTSSADGAPQRRLPVLVTHGDSDRVVSRRAIERWVGFERVGTKTGPHLLAC
jgi:predicted esterase